MVCTDRPSELNCWLRVSVIWVRLLRSSPTEVAVFTSGNPVTLYVTATESVLVLKKATSMIRTRDLCTPANIATTCLNAVSTCGDQSCSERPDMVHVTITTNPPPGARDVETSALRDTDAAMVRLADSEGSGE